MESVEFGLVALDEDINAPDDTTAETDEHGQVVAAVSVAALGGRPGLPVDAVLR